MKLCCIRMKSEQKGAKIKTGKKVSALLPMIVTFLATQHWLHGLLFIMLGGTANELMSMSADAMLPVQRVMIVLTLVTILWSVYQLVKDGFKHKGMMTITFISSLIGIGYVIMALVNNGW